MGAEEIVLPPEHHKHEQIKLFSAHATHAASQVSAAWVLGIGNQGHGSQQPQETWTVLKTTEMVEVWGLGLHRLPGLVPLQMH